MVASLSWAGDASGNKLKIVFNDPVEKSNFLKEVTAEAKKLGLNFPLLEGGPNALLIDSSKYPTNPCGCYASPGGKLAINFGKVQLRDVILAKLGVKSELAEIPGQHNTIFFHKDILKGMGSELTFHKSPTTPKASTTASMISKLPQQPHTAAPLPAEPAATKTTEPKAAAPVNNDTTIKAVGTSAKPRLQITFPNKEKLHTFLTNVKNKAKTLNINSEALFDIQEPNTIIINPSNYPVQKAGCFISKNNEVTINFGNNEFREFVLSQLDVDTSYGIKPAANEIGNDSFYFNNKLRLNGEAMTIKKAQPLNFDAIMDKTRSFVWNEFLRKPYNNEFRQPPDKQTIAAWEKHMGPPDNWEHWSNMGQDWDMKISPGTIIQRPNHGLPHTFRVAELVPVIAEFLKEYGDPKFKTLSEKDIQKAQFMMLFSVIGRENDMSWTDANHLLQAYREAHKGEQSEHLYAKFKKNAEKGFLDFVNANKTELIPSLFDNETEVKRWAEALDTGKPGISSPAGILMAVAHDMDLMRCYDSGKFENLKMKDLTNKLGGNREAADKIATYANNLIIATGDRCMGYGKKQNYNTHVFGKCSLDNNQCLQHIQSVDRPAAKSSAGLKL